MTDDDHNGCQRFVVMMTLVALAVIFLLIALTRRPDAVTPIERL
ncbi:hypothetical protein [Antrihabitans spumae]|uniref:Uncharacterized protein n=1 Tax=Antrihabitans spumae TaxID=3373370 RepID=A0ABW7KY16_9NOCA